MTIRAPRLAFLVLPGLDHFAGDLLAHLPGPALEVREFTIRRPEDLRAACAWADDPARDALWFEFCWPPFPAMIASHDFAGRRVIMRIHRIEAYGSGHAAAAPWHKIDDVIVVSEDMAARLRREAPALAQTTTLHVVHNGVDVERFAPGKAEPFRIGWCGWLSLHKNPIMALEILHLLRQSDRRWHLHLCAKGGDPVAVDSFNLLKRRLQLDDAVIVDGEVPQAGMPAWHARNSVLLSTSVYESFGYAIAEAACCGCDIAMLDQAGASEFWPSEMRFATTAEAAAMICVSRPNRWRARVMERFSLDRQIAQLREILRPRAMAGAMEVGSTDDLLEAVARRPGALRLARRLPDEMEAAALLLAAMGYARAGRDAGSVTFALQKACS